MISQIGNLGFQKGWSHAIRNLGQLCELACSFDVTAKHPHLGLEGGVMLDAPTSLFPPTAYALCCKSWLDWPPKRFMRQNWHFPIVFQNYCYLEPSGKLANCVPIKWYFLSFPFLFLLSDHESLVYRHSLFLKLLEAGAISRSKKKVTCVFTYRCWNFLLTPFIDCS